MVHAGNNLGINRLAASRMFGAAGGGTNGKDDMNEATRPRRRQGHVLRAVAFAAALVACLASPRWPPQRPTPVATTSSTKLTLTKGFTNKLKKSGVKIQAVAPATVQGNTLTLAGQRRYRNRPDHRPGHPYPRKRPEVQEGQKSAVVKKLGTRNRDQLDQSQSRQARA